MKLTDKCKQDFEKWFFKRFKILPSKEPTAFSTPFYDYDNSFKYGVLVDFFDSVEMYIEIQYRFFEDKWQFKIHIDNGKPDFRMFGIKTRQEAREQAIIKANEIYNDKH